MDLSCHRNSSAMNLIFGPCQCSTCSSKSKSSSKCQLEIPHSYDEITGYGNIAGWRLMSCYSKTISGLQDHIDCCRQHYPQAIIYDNDIRTPEQNSSCFWFVPMFLSKDNPTDRCPYPIKDRPCEIDHGKDML